MSLHRPTAFNNQTCLNIAHPAVYKTVQRGCQIKQLKTAISKIPTFVQTTNEKKSLESTNDLFIQCSRLMTNFGSFEMFPVSQNIFNNIVEPLIYDPHGTGLRTKYKKLR